MQTVIGFFGALRMTKGNDVEIDNPSTADAVPLPYSKGGRGSAKLVGASIARPLGKTKLTQRVILREAKDLL